MNKNADFIKKIITNPIHFLAFGLGLGLLPFIPGTFGTLLGVLIYILNKLYLGYSEIIIIIFSFILGVYLCGKTAKALNHHDHPGIVFDEVVGYLITMCNTMGLISFNLTHIILGFLLFRIFDIIKPWPISYVDRKVQGGFGIMFDDVLAGVCANIVLNIIIKHILI